MKQTETGPRDGQGRVILTGDLTTNRTLLAGEKYILQGTYRVKSGSTLSIPAGTVIMGDKASTGALLIERGARIDANGTAQQPIVFTSGQAKGAKNAGDWGGIVILGNAPTNKPTTTHAEGLTNAPYGGTDARDNSGRLRYVRIEFAGVSITPNNEINGLTLAGVGSGTTIEYVQVSFSGDDAFEWFGGTVNARYLIAYRSRDDDFDTDFGYSGKVQFGVALRDPAIADQSQSNGIESDNDNVATASTPLTSAVFSNMSLFGPLGRNAANVNALFGRGAHLRRNTAQSIYNSLITGFPAGGLVIDGGSNTMTNVNSGALKVQNVIVAGNSNNLLGAGGAATTDVTTWFNTPANNNQALADFSTLNLNASNFNLTAPNFLPQTGSPLLTGAAFTDSKVGDTFFQKVTHIGAFGTTNWAQGWTNFDPQGTQY